MNEALRQSGRTTRMVREALRLSSCGFAVYIVVHDKSYARLVRQQVEHEWRLIPAHQVDHGRPHGIKVEPLQDLGAWDWEKMSVPRSHPNCRFLVDHALLERYIEQLHADIARKAALIGRLYPLTV